MVKRLRRKGVLGEPRHVITDLTCGGCNKDYCASSHEEKDNGTATCASESLNDQLHQSKRPYTILIVIMDGQRERKIAADH